MTAAIQSSFCQTVDALLARLAAAEKRARKKIALGAHPKAGASLAHKQIALRKAKIARQLLATTTVNRALEPRWLAPQEVADADAIVEAVSELVVTAEDHAQYVV